MKRPSVVLDTNVFIAAGFNPKSHAAEIVRQVERGDLDLVWNEAARRETERLVRRIPGLSWRRFAPLFRREHEYAGAVDPGAFAHIADPDDRKFAALAAAADSALITNDAHLLAHRGRPGLRILTPAEFVARGGR